MQRVARDSAASPAGARGRCCRACGRSRTASRRLRTCRRARSRRSWSSTVRPLAASAMVTPMPVAKLMPSWHAPQASAAGPFFQLSPCAVLRGRGGRAVVALGAVAEVLRERDFVVQHAAVVVVLLGQQLAHVDLVDVVGQVADRAAVDLLGGAGERQRGRVDRGLGSAVLALLGVADHAVAGFVAAAAVEAGARTLRVVARNAAELAVAFVALGGGDDVAARSPSPAWPVAGMKS